MSKGHSGWQKVCAYYRISPSSDGGCSGASGGCCGWRARPLTDRDDANPSVAILEDREGLDDQMLLRSMYGQGPGLRFKTLGIADALTRGWCCPHRQEPDRELDPAVGAWAVELVVCWVAAQRQARRCDHEPDPVSAHQWA